jgi:hypothetical protein
MANYEQKNGQITVWKNNKYEVGGNQPYAKGKGLDLNGKECDFTLWIPKSDKIKGFNLVISEPYVNQVENQHIAEEKQATNQPTNDLPF